MRGLSVSFGKRTSGVVQVVEAENQFLHNKAYLSSIRDGRKVAILHWPWLVSAWRTPSLWHVPRNIRVRCHRCYQHWSSPDCCFCFNWCQHGNIHSSACVSFFRMSSPQCVRFFLQNVNGPRPWRLSFDKKYSPYSATVLSDGNLVIQRFTSRLTV